VETSARQQQQGEADQQPLGHGRILQSLC